jgi:AraC family transcriptional regulator
MFTVGMRSIALLGRSNRSLFANNEMSTDPILTLDFSEAEATAQVLPRPPIVSSHQSGWKNLHLNHFVVPAGEIPEVVSEQHTLTLFSVKTLAVMEVILEGKVSPPSQSNLDRILLIPTDVPFTSRWLSEVDITTCHLDTQFVDRIANEAAGRERIELIPKFPFAHDPLIWQLVTALRQALETAPTNSHFYAESLATALAAQLMQFYATRPPTLRAYRGGLPQQKLNLALEYINAHLSEDLSLTALAAELNISQYYLCRLFKQSIGITPHAYLVRQRVERSKQLLKDKENLILDIAIACGFANPSHFAKCFRREIGISPKQFQRI